MITDKILDDFKTFATKKHDISFNEKEYLISLERIKTSIKAEIARQKWLELGAYYVFNQTDKEIKIAIEALQ